MTKDKELHEGDIVDIKTFDNVYYAKAKLLHIPHNPRELWAFEIPNGSVVFTEGPIIVIK